MKLFDELLNTDAGLLSKYERVVKQIELLEPAMQQKTDEQLKEMTALFKSRLEAGERKDKMLPEIFATVREAAVRVLSQRAYPVQLLGGIAMCKGDIAEMKTGEGKTLTAIFPVYYYALDGKGVHMITVNEYLAHRDAEWMGEIYRFLGLTVGCNSKDLPFFKKKEAYNCDITYTTNSELGFDYLRDNLASDKTGRVQRGLYVALIDEVDSVLIDESRTPLIIAGQGNDLSRVYMIADLFVKSLKENDDYLKDVQSNSVYLTEDGIAKAEKFYHVDSLYNQNQSILPHTINNALRANYMMNRDVEYMVSEDEIVLIDQFTGRKMAGREFSEGLHQAIQAKEKVLVKQESKTIATITYQNFFRLYTYLCGMTGTAKTEEDEFLETYNMRVLPIPTNRPIARIDEPDLIFATKKEKYEAIVRDVKALYDKGQPVLVGTISVDVSESLSDMFTKKGIAHQVLNAKNDAYEAQIIQMAGQVKKVTIATNMAARGTDIKLSEEAKALGGLAVIASERHDAKRIDNQLMGRSGRQGDPGFSRFYVSMEDELVLRYKSEAQDPLIEKVKKGDFDLAKTRKMMNDIQKYAEVQHYGNRKNTLEFDNVLMDQRRNMYSLRDEIIDKSDVSDIIDVMMENTADVLAEYMNEVTTDMQKKQICDTYGLPREIIEEDIKASKIEKCLKDTLAQREEELMNLTRMKKGILIKTIDSKWQDHVDGMERLKKGIYLRSYAQHKPADAYKEEGYQRFDAMMHSIEMDTVRLLMTIRLPKKEEESTDVSE